jgi:hypothetical protein
LQNSAQESACCAQNFTFERNQRFQQAAGQLDGLAPQKRGPKPDPQAIELAKLRRENARLQDRLERAQFIIDFQKKWRRCLGRRWRLPIWTI